ncbi:spore protein H [Metabacillus sp. Hm71]|uniref:spore protein H n=1 Tax=Metabacillus sp. Hm71 TaxID=3450743 RepID=UPI003F43EDBD
MIVRVTFSEDHVMLFGDSYKPWRIQLDEYMWSFKPEKVLNVESSHSKWVGWGGLKWCPDSKFQHQLNREGCQDNDPDNPKPRQYHKMNFKYDPKKHAKALEILSGYLK